MMATKYRITYAVTVILLIILGLSSRRFSDQLPFFIAANSGDVLWASMVYFGFRCVFTNISLPWAFVAAMTFSFLIEFSQLYQADWINVIRHTTLGALVLGKGFLWVDLIRYLVGITIAFFADVFFIKRVIGTASKV